MWCMSQCCVNITCRSINSCYFCSKSCKWLLRIKNIKILNMYNFSAQWVENWLQSRRYGSIPRAATVLRVSKYEKWRSFLYPANIIALFSLTLIIVMCVGKLQNCAARILMSASYDSNWDNVFRALGWHTLPHQRLEKRSIMMSKTLHRMTSEYLR